MQACQCEGFVVIGLSARVRNDDPAAIGSLWAQFQSRDLATVLGVSASQNVYCVYHEYEGGFLDPYRMTIGYRVSAATEIPAGLYRAQIAEQDMATFRAEGPQPETLIGQWQAIWQGDLNRAYIADYDIYDAARPDLVVVHVGITQA